MPERCVFLRRFSHTDASHEYRCVFCTFHCFVQAHTSSCSSALIRHLPNVRMIRLLHKRSARVTGMESFFFFLKKLSFTSWFTTKEGDYWREDGGLNVYLKYIQKVVAVSLSCAGFTTVRFQSAMLEVCLLLITAQCYYLFYFFLF